jgi:hypothetical protein
VHPAKEAFDFFADEQSEPRYKAKMRLAELISEPIGPAGASGRFPRSSCSCGIFTGSDEGSLGARLIVADAGADGRPLCGPCLEPRLSVGDDPR